ncbi:hypothetical protein S40285_05371 [Stachybotrys chlorohalonatus IBT 40285]|uniref:Pectate lyase n=1 Tax=Stachybotrys chlorohalonatus (strain IBT 40285) TaxID=1283841 RepID=A0A084QPE2_STAC4|nr:hypothetical protein S40285_05371 [Stachybotrys chlorohalonata IBT 40285]
MHAYILLTLVPAALGCANANSNSCASFIKSQAATASPFCNTFTQNVVTATVGLPSWATNCSNKPSQISKECSCYYTGGGSNPPPATTQATATTIRTSTTQGGGGSVPTGVTTTLPASSGAVSSPTAIVVSGTFDGGMRKYDRSTKVCADQDETGEADAIFILEPGATLQNVIIGPNQAEGVHCRGTCTLNNVWWTDVCEDAATFKMSSGTSYVNGGGAFKAADKIFQFNGFGTLQISNFYAEDYGKVVRSCGNCSNNSGARHIVIRNSVAVDGGILCGINTNYGDTCTVTNTCQQNNKICDRYTGAD